VIAFTCTPHLGWPWCVELSGDLLEDYNMHPADFADADTLVCTFSLMLYQSLQAVHDEALDKAMNPLGLVVPWEMRSAKVRNCWETVVRRAFQNMAIIGDTAHGLRILKKPAALELQDNEAIM
jgi:hypothetical protein